MMTALWLQNLLFYSLQVLLVVLAGGALLWLSRLRDARAELFYLQGLLAICLLLPVVQAWQDSPPRAAVDLAAAVVIDSGITAEDSGGSAGRLSPFRAAMWLLAAGIALRFAWISIGLLRLARYRAKSEELSPPPPFAAVLEAQLGTKADLRVSSEVRGPVTFGWLRPVVLLPQRFLEFAPELQRAVICHELLHVQRRDWLFTVAEESVRAVLWFHPAVWWLIGRIHLVREQLVDREAIRLTDSRDPYLRALLAVAGHHIQPDLAPASLFLRKHHLDQRVAAVLRKEIPMSRIRSIAWLSLMSSAVIVATWLVSSTFPLKAVPQAMSQAEAAERDQLEEAMQAIERRLYSDNPVIAPAGVIEQGGENLLHEPRIFYSEEALKKGVEGRVVLELSVNENGSVYDAMVISGPPELRRPALMSVLRWQYSGQMALPTKLAVTIRFELPPPDAVGSGALSDPGAPSKTKRIRVSGAVQRPRLLRQVRPEYPALARQTEVQGIVRLNVSISPEGTVEFVDVESGHPLLIPAALNAVKHWQYKPTLLNGVPVGVETEVNITFRLPDTEP